MFFLAYPGDGHEDFSFGKLSGFLLIVIGVLMFNKIFDFNFGINFGQQPSAVKGLQLNLSTDCRQARLELSDEKSALLKQPRFTDEYETFSSPDTAPSSASNSPSCDFEAKASPLATLM